MVHVVTPYMQQLQSHLELKMAELFPQVGINPPTSYKVHFKPFSHALYKVNQVVSQVGEGTVAH